MKRQSKVSMPASVSQKLKFGAPKSDISIINDINGKTTFSGSILINTDAKGLHALLGIKQDDLKQILSQRLGPLDYLQSYFGFHIRIIPTNIQLVQLDTVPYHMVLGIATNNSKGPMTAHFNTKVQYQQSFSSTWSKQITLGLQVSSTIGLDLQFFSSEHTVTVNTSTTFGKQESSTKTISYGSESGIQIEIPAGQSITARMDASRGKAQIKVSYKASLQGEFMYIKQYLWNNKGQDGKPHRDKWESYNIVAQQIQILDVSSVDGFNIEVRNNK